MRPTIISAYDGTPAGADGLALGGLCADLAGADLIVARVLPDTPSSETTDRGEQAAFRAALHETRIAAAKVLGDRVFELWPVFGSPVASGVRDLAADRNAALIVFGSPHHGPVGRVLLGSAAKAAIEGAPCAVAVAPRGFRERAAIEPPAIGVAFDGSPESVAALDAGVAIAGAAGVRLRVIAVEPPAWNRPIHQPHPVGPELVRRCAELVDDVDVDPVVLHGDVARRLAHETEGLGLLVCGSRARGPLRRVMLGSVSSAVLRKAACPVVVVPRRLGASAEALGAAGGRALTHH